MHKHLTTYESKHGEIFCMSTQHGTVVKQIIWVTVSKKRTHKKVLFPVHLHAWN